MPHIKIMKIRQNHWVPSTLQAIFLDKTFWTVSIYIYKAKKCRLKLCFDVSSVDPDPAPVPSIIKQK
jgi:hypothetical protein